jgi:hypothetical protein
VLIDSADNGNANKQFKLKAESSDTYFAIGSSNNPETLNIRGNVKSVGVGTVTPAGSSTECVIDVENPTASSTTEGGNLRLSSNDGAALGDTHRLGVVEFAAAEDGSSTITVGARIEAVADAAWGAAENGANLDFYTTDGDAVQTKRMSILATGEMTTQYASPEAPGAGIAAAATVNVEKINGDIITTITVDIGGLDVDGSLTQSVIGSSGVDPSYLTQLTTANNGVIYKITMACVELPTVGTLDIDLASDPASKAEGAAASSKLFGPPAMGPPPHAWESFIYKDVGGESALPDLANEYIYLTSGENGAAAATYGAGKFIIKFYGANF